jgi:hypothetical protein
MASGASGGVRPPKNKRSDLANFYSRVKSPADGVVAATGVCRVSVSVRILAHTPLPTRARTHTHTRALPATW